MIDSLLAEIAETLRDGLEQVDTSVANWSGPGVYVLLDFRGVPLYVGQSTNVALRLRQHADKDFRGVRVYNVPDLADRLRVETLLIVCLRPRLNRGVMLGFHDGVPWEIRWPGTKKKGPRRRRARRFE